MQDMVSSNVCFVSWLGIYSGNKATTRFRIVLQIVTRYKPLCTIISFDDIICLTKSKLKF